MKNYVSKSQLEAIENLVSEYDCIMAYDQSNENLIITDNDKENKFLLIFKFEPQTIVVSSQANRVSFKYFNLWNKIWNILNAMEDR